MKVEVSNGELLDKLSILELKLLHIKDKNKLVNINREFSELKPLANNLFKKYKRSKCSLFLWFWSYCVCFGTSLLYNK